MRAPTLVSAGVTSAFAGVPVGISAGLLEELSVPQSSFSISGVIVGIRWQGPGGVTYLLSGGCALFYAGGAKRSNFQSIAGMLSFGAQADRDTSGSVLWMVPFSFRHSRWRA